MGITKFNKSAPLFSFSAPEDFEYHKLSEFAADANTDKVFKINAFFIGKGTKYGSNPVVVTDFCYINLPKHMLETVINIMNDSEAVREINNGEAGFKIYSYVDKLGGTSYSIEFVKSELPF